MNEIDGRLNSTDTVIIPQIFSRLINNITEKLQRGDKDVIELNYLKDKCVCRDDLVNLTAAKAILTLIENGVLDNKAVLSDFLTTITTTKCCSNIAVLINNLLLNDITEILHKNEPYKCPFNLRLPQHPFITILNEDPSSWRAIFKEISNTYNNQADFNTISIYNEAYKSLFFYTICDPSSTAVTPLKEKLWTLIINNESPLTPNNLLSNLLSWMQLECANSIEVNSDLIIELSDLNLERNIFDPDLLILIQTSVLYQLISNRNDPRIMISSIENVLKYHNDLTMANPMLLIIAKAIAKCPAIYLSELLNLTSIVIKSANLITRAAVKATLLHWIANSSILTNNSVEIANSIINEIDKMPQTLNKSTRRYEKFYKKNVDIINSNAQIYFSIQVNILTESWNNNSDVIIFLNKLENSPNFFLSKMYNILEALLIVNFYNSEIDLKIFALIRRCRDFNAKKLSGKILTMVLYKITNTTDPELHLKLLNTLPELASVKDNMFKVLSTIQALNRAPNRLKTMSTLLLYNLWKVENKIYVHLENNLITPYDGQSDKWEFYITRAYILKQLCALKPELYGKEIVAHLSKILNECSDDDGAVACALAIDGITSLCKFEIIDAVTTWATLSPLLENDSRIAVIKNICRLISEIPTLSYIDAYPKLTEDVLTKLWHYLKMNRDKDIWEAALNAMTAFNLENIVAAMPSEYLDEETAKSRKDGQTISGLCWVTFLKNCERQLLSVAGDFLSKMVKIEIDGYLKFVYQVKGTREPVDYGILPINSVVRGIASYIKSKVVKWKFDVYREVYLECLRIFSCEYSKPLPPLDWCFLQELIHEPDAKDYCIAIASHQVVLSGTARRFIVNYIEAVTQNPNSSDILCICKNLKYLANSIQPFTLKPLLEVALKMFTVESADKKELEVLLKCLKTTLVDGNIQESNKVVIGQIISEIIEKIEMSNQLFELLLGCLIKAPIKCIDDISSPKMIKEMTSQCFQKALKIHTRLAIETQKSPLNMLNDIIEIAHNFTEYQEMLFEEFMHVFIAHKNNTECTLWVLELIGQIQAMIGDKYIIHKLTLMCDIFILATVVFSGHFVFMDSINTGELRTLFPRAIATLLDINHWSICTNQALEWFYHMKTENIFSDEYRDIFGQCLKALRHEEEFKKNMKWIKYLNI